MAWTGLENFDSYSTGTSISTLAGGSGWSAAWVKGGSGTATIETAPAGGQGGNALKITGTTAVSAARDITGVSSGKLRFLVRLSSATPDEQVVVGISSAAMYIQFRADSQIAMYNTQSGVYDDIQAYSANTWYTIDLEFNDSSQPDKYRVRIDEGTWTSWVTCGAFSTVTTFYASYDTQSPSMDVWIDGIRDGDSISFSDLTAGDISSGTDATSYASGSWTPPSGLIIAFATSVKTVGGDPTQPTMSGNGLTWTAITSLLSLNGTCRTTLFGANGAGATAGATTVDFGGLTQRDCSCSFLQADGADVANGVAQCFVQSVTGTHATDTSLTITLAAATSSNNRPVANFVNTGAASGITPRANWVEYFDTLPDSHEAAAQYRPDAFETTASASDGAGPWLGIATEIKAEVSPTTIYSATSIETNSNYNWNEATDNYAATFTPSTSGTPTKLWIHVLGIAGTPVGNFYIRNQNTVSGATTYATATGITLSAGQNVIYLTGGTALTASTTYYLWFARTTASTVYPQFQYKSTGASLTQYRATAINADPTTSWFTGDINFNLTGNEVAGPANLKTVDGLAKASVKTINGLAIASVKTVNGLA